jgi:hypothetical protein
VRKIALAFTIVFVAALVAAAGAPAKKPVLTLSEELPGGELRPLQAGDPYFATDEPGIVAAWMEFAGESPGYVECRTESASSTYSGTLQSNGQRQDSIVLEGVTGGLNGEGGTCYTGAKSEAAWGELRITLSGFPFTLDLGPWSKETAGKIKAGKLKGSPLVTVHSSVVGSCVYHGKWGVVSPARRLEGNENNEPIPQDWSDSMPTLMGLHGNPAACPKHARYIGDSLVSEGPGGAPVQLALK